LDDFVLSKTDSAIFQGGEVKGDDMMVPDIKKILYATDLSENARYAFGYAVSLANRHDAKITVLHVVEELSSFARSMVEDILGEKRWAELRKEKEAGVISGLQSQLDKFFNEVRRSRPDYPFLIDQTIVVTGHPVDQIIRYAEEKNMDLIVIGSHGKGSLADVTMGTTSRRVLRRCSKPVLVVRLPEGENK
jgi:nucleotide-binding universal stress UspA family protein